MLRKLTQTGNRSASSEIGSNTQYQTHSNYNSKHYKTIIILLSLLVLLFIWYVPNQVPTQDARDIKDNEKENSWYQYIAQHIYTGAITKTGKEGGAWSMSTHFKLKRHLMFDHGLANFIAFKLAPKSALDFGSGIGLYIDYDAQYYYKYDSRNVFDSHMTSYQSKNGLFIGIEPEPMISAGIFGKYSSQLVMDIFNVAKSVLLSMPVFDVVTSFEVAEHIPYQYHDQLISFLVSKCSKYLVFSAAHPGQGGIGHLKESMFHKEEWVAKFEEKGMKYLPHLSQMVRDKFCRLHWFRSNLIIMAKTKTNVADIDQCDLKCEQDIINAQREIINDSKLKLQKQFVKVMLKNDTISELRYLTQNIWSTYWLKYQSENTKSNS